MSTATLERPAGPFWHDIVLSFVPPAKRGARVRALLGRLPLTLIFVVQAVLSWRLSNVAFNDEALYIDAGHDLIAHALHGAVDSHAYGTYFSGSPVGYPVVAGVLDGIGGLTLVRLFSLVCMLVATACVYRSSQKLFGDRAALYSALTFSVSGSVLFLGKYATYDAPCLMLIAVALWLTVTRRSVLSGLPIGLLLALAATTKYAGLSLIPFVLLLGLLPGTAYLFRDIARVVLAALTAGGLLIGGYLMWGSSIAVGVRFTTTSRKALDFQSYPYLLGQAARDVGLLAALAVLAAVTLAVQRSWRKLLTVLTFLAAGAVIPASQIRIHEYISLDKHTAFSALFFAVPAGFAVEWALRRQVRVKACVFVVAWVLLVAGLWRSNVQYEGWPASITKPIGAVEANPVPGRYLSFDADSERYYTKAYPALQWDAAYYVFDQGTEAVLNAVKSGEYTGFVFRSCPLAGVAKCSATNNQSDAQAQRAQTAMLRLLMTDARYHLTASYPVDPYTGTRWYVWQRATVASRPAAVVTPAPSTPATSRTAAGISTPPVGQDIAPRAKLVTLAVVSATPLGTFS